MLACLPANMICDVQVDEHDDFGDSPLNGGRAATICT
jgi:hypothetical protein